MRSSTAICFAILAFASKSATAEEGRIYDGYAIDISQAKYMAQVYFLHDNNYESRCGGGILRQDLILTAGHCD